MKLVDIKKHFNIISSDERGKYLLFKDNNYCGTIIYDSNKKCVTIKNPIHSDSVTMSKKCNIDDLFNTIEDIKKSLPFPLEFYNPTYQNSWFIQLCIDYYLKNIGFTQNAINFHNYIYTLTNTNNCGFNGNLTFIISIEEDINTNNIKGQITMELSSYKSLNCNFDNLNNAIISINSMMKLAFASSITYLIEKSNIIINKEINFDNITIIEQDPNNPFKIYTNKVKQQTIEMFEHMLVELKK